MKRIVLIGATTALLMFGSVAAVFSQPDRPDDQKEKHDKNDNPGNGKGKAGAPGQNKGQQGQGNQQGQPPPPQPQGQQQAHERQKQADRQQGEQARQQPAQAQEQKQVAHEQKQHTPRQPNVQPAANQQRAAQQELRQQQTAQHEQRQAVQQTHERARVASRQDQSRIQPQTRSVQLQGHLPQPEQQQRVVLGQQRATAYQTVLSEQVRVGETQNAQIRQSRGSQFLIQQQYAARLQQQNAQLARNGSYNYSGDPYYNSPWTYRYSFGGRYVETNRYGADLLRQSVRYGYQEGFYAGDADRRDHWRNNYRDSFAYRDANYGYSGRYVEQREYNYYFREGFRKGYEDGYYRRSRYGHRVHGTVTVLSVVIPSVLRLQLIR